MNKPYQKTLEEGKHITTVANVYQGNEIIKGRKVDYFELKFENESGCIYQKFHLNEYGRDFLMEPFFRRFDIIPNAYNVVSLQSTFDSFIGRKVSLTVYTNEKGQKEAMAYNAVPGDYINPLGPLVNIVMNRIDIYSGSTKFSKSKLEGAKYKRRK